MKIQFFCKGNHLSFALISADFADVQSTQLNYQIILNLLMPCEAKLPLLLVFLFYLEPTLSNGWAVKAHPKG